MCGNVNLLGFVLSGQILFTFSDLMVPPTASACCCCWTTLNREFRSQTFLAREAQSPNMYRATASSRTTTMNGVTLNKTLINTASCCCRSTHTLCAIVSSSTTCCPGMLLVLPQFVRRETPLHVRKRGWTHAHPTACRM